MLNRLADTLSVCSKAFAGVACAILAVLISYVVFERFVMHTTPAWAEELPRLVMVWAAFVGGVVCSHERSHLTAGLLPFIMRSPRWLGVIDRINHILVIVGWAVLGYAGWQLAQITMNQMLPAINVSAGVVYLALPVACGITVLVHLAQLLSPPPITDVEET